MTSLYRIHPQPAFNFGGLVIDNFAGGGGALLKVVPSKGVEYIAVPPKAIQQSGRNQYCLEICTRSIEQGYRFVILAGISDFDLKGSRKSFELTIRLVYRLEVLYLANQQVRTISADCMFSIVGKRLAGSQFMGFLSDIFNPVFLITWTQFLTDITFAFTPCPVHDVPSGDSAIKCVKRSPLRRQGALLRCRQRNSKLSNLPTQLVEHVASILNTDYALSRTALLDSISHTRPSHLRGPHSGRSGRTRGGEKP